MTRSTSARDTILAAVRSALPRPAVELPALPNSEQQFGAVGGVGYRGHLTSLEPVTRPSPDCESLVPYFQSQLEAMGGKSFVIASLSEAEMKFRECFPQAGVVCSTIRELPGNRPLDATQDARDFADVEVAVFRSHLGIAEAGAIWLSDADLVIPAVGVLTQHLVVVLDPADIVATLHEAYSGRLDPSTNAYGVFMAGPSSTGDIEGVIIQGAQGARSLTVLIVPV